MREPCIGIMGRLLGHRFEARYDERVVPPGNIGSFKGNVYGMEMMLDKMTERTRTYRGDICRRCGLSADKEGQK